MSAMVTFAADSDGFRKRKRVHKACDACKRRRKRCSHVFNESEGKHTGVSVTPEECHRDGVSLGSESREAGQRPKARRQTEFTNGVSTIEIAQTTNEQYSNDMPEPRDDGRDQEPSRFVGYLAPEAQLRGQLRAQKDNADQLIQHYCGHWVAWQHNFKSGLAGDLAPSSTIVGPEDQSVAHNFLRAYLDAIGVNLRPPRKHQDVLIQIYFEYIHPILPLVDEAKFRRQYGDAEEPRLLLQTICILAAKHDKARSHLYLDDSSVVYNPRDFSRKLFSSATAALEAKLETDRITLIQSLALLSLHCEGFDGAEQASMHLSQAVHHAHTVGLQFGQKQGTMGHGLETIFWCLWSLDKLNACINGRPLLMHDRDQHIPRLEESSERRTPFGIWLQLADALDKVICYYRPGLPPDKTGWEEDFPSFEDIIGEGGDSLDAPILAFLELFYHAVAMASHRSMAINDPVKATPSYTRQSLSAVRVVSILKDESPDNLPPLPIIPYALSLAASTAYRRFRQSKLQTHKSRGKEDLKRCCELLNKLRISFWSAGATADLGKAALSKANSQDLIRQDRPKHSGSKYVEPSGNVQASVNGTHISDIQGPATITQNSVSDTDVAAAQALSSLQTTRLPTPSFADEILPPTSGESLDWLNFDHAFENMETLLGSAGADESSYLLRPFSIDTSMPGMFSP
ncbi:hypothetical protein EJ05DRAFT_435380 [Pseudovirgaria hyperparasitica]|uniref:Xylanolytic transcriptional activator regulatory domain-containing protein n=1 Tax=Pseudovirgaria hyperparasitica TaxID=470096 RepID=A0A6A6WGD5_9PEZI|nr:uncharacterized protein EJ05DRAFT_435380 [Pseudovirgaria hyperparasitica]KAF2761016.1 hypothetical protein EJ05DRAFT_435380 [Pseudovirgaria hyperparasitica]